MSMGSDTVILANAYRDVGSTIPGMESVDRVWNKQSRATQDAKADAGVQGFKPLDSGIKKPPPVMTGVICLTSGWVSMDHLAAHASLDPQFNIASVSQRYRYIH